MNHFALIHTMVSNLPLELARTLYKCVLADFVRLANRAQPSASNVGKDLAYNVKPQVVGDAELHYMDYEDYAYSVSALADQWERATVNSKKALHQLRIVDDTITIGKMRTGVNKYAYGSFEHALATFDGVERASGENLEYEDAIKRAKKDLGTDVADTQGIPIAHMGTPPSLPSAPPKVINYIVF